MQYNKKGIIMNEEIKTTESIENEGASNLEQDTQTEDTQTISRGELEKQIQSAEDKLRTKYSKEIKALETKVKELSPVQKSDTEIELENRLAEIEGKQKSVEAQEKRLQLLTALQSKNIDKSIADYVKEDIDVEAFESIIQNMVTEKMKSTGYVPSGHQSNEGISKDKWKGMSYSEKSKIFETNPDLASKLMSM